jgi:hypothetical protein
MSVDPDPIRYLEGQYSHKKLPCFEELSGGLLLEFGPVRSVDSQHCSLPLTYLIFTVILLHIGFRLRSGWR